MNLRENEHGLSEVVGFVLLLGILVAAFSLWMTYVVPVEGREKEIEHMDGVNDRFTDYKITLDSLWINNRSGTTVSTSINLGTGGGTTQAGGLFIPLLKPISSSATLSLRNLGDTITINSSSTEGIAAVRAQFPLTMNTVEYQSNNNYWIQQRYYYQLGGVFLSQDDGITNRVSPPFSISNGTTFAAVSITPVQITGGGVIGGTGPVRIDTRMKSLPQFAISSFPANAWVNISVNVTDISTATMWLNLFNGTAEREQIDKGWYNSSVKENPVTKRATAFINITGPSSNPGTNDVSLSVTRAEYYVVFNNIASGFS
jgi:hypothetical protein